ncbi:MAG TPA: hypothetical protein VE913_24405 [Longimicrobium sp.]|nr:hypothetical protein [Longimicrobium sp.]
MLRIRSALAALAAIFVAAACDSPSGSPEPVTLVVEVRGAAVRDSVVRVAVRRGTTLLAPGAYTLTASPADGVQPLGGDSLRFLRVGPVTFTATENENSGSLQVEVAAPPPITVEVRGAIVRDSVARVVVTRAGVPVPAGGYTLAANPADAVQLLGGDSVRFLRVGAVTLTASIGPDAGTRQLDVAAAPPLVLAVAGRLERGSVIRVSATRSGTPVPPADLTLTATPADAIQPLGGDSARLTRAGSVTITAVAGRDAGARTITVAVPPSVVFDRVVAGNRDIWRVALDGGDLMQLTDDAAEDLDATVAAGRVVFVSYRADRNAELFAVSLGGGAVTRITTTARNEGVPALSPDGSRLAFTAELNGVSKLFTSAGDGSGATRATTGFGFDGSIESTPSWAPTGARLAFMATTSGTADIFELTVPGTPTLLAGGNSADFEPAFSPDGRFVAFGSDRSGNGGADVFILRFSDRQLTRLTTRAASEGQPTWTADGRLVYVEFGGSGGQLRWLDPNEPTIIHSINTGAGSARNPAGIL